MSWRLVLARRRQILQRLGRKNSTDFADRSISKKAELVEWHPLTTRCLVSKGSSRRSQKSQTCDEKQPRGYWPDQPKYTAGKEGSRSTKPATTCRRRPEALGNKASPREWCPQGCGASASHGRTATRTQNNAHPHAACGGGKSSEASRATRAHTQRVEDDEKALRTERK